MSKQILTQNDLKRLLHYDCDSGVFTWLFSNANRIKVGDIAGCKHPRGYVVIRLNNKLHRAHRLAFLYMDGEFPISQVDHINHICDDNRWGNLRRVTNLENGKNQSQKSNNTSGFTGVDEVKPGKWRSRIWIEGKALNLGRFINLSDAVLMRLQAERAHDYHLNHGKVIA